MQRIEFTLDDSKNEIQFLVSRASEWLVMKFGWEETMTWGELWLIDPAGRLRFTYMDVYQSRTAIIHRDVGLNSYTGVPGEIDAGLWTVQFIRHVPRHFELEWEYGTDELPTAWSPIQTDRDYWTTGLDSDTLNLSLDAYDWERSLESGNRWYKGDCHAHTTLSDGRMTPEKLTEQAVQRGLDFFFSTDHNTLPSSWPIGKVLVIPGMEFTSFGRGDWNALGIKEWIPCWDEEHGGLRTDKGQQSLLEEAAKQGALRVINHPINGRFSWRYPKTLLASIDAIEIWNSPYHMQGIISNERALMLWTALWNDGYRIPGLGGSDIHRLPEESFGFIDGSPAIGDPSTYVYADALTPAVIVRAIRAGHTYVSRGPELHARYTVDGCDRTFLFGDDLTEAMEQSNSGIVRCDLSIRSAKGNIIRLIVDGAEVDAKRIFEDTQQLEFTFSWKSVQYAWSRLEVRSENNQLLAVSNPVSCGIKTTTLKTWEELLRHVGFVLPD